MRKSFTRFLGLLTLFVVLGFQVSLAGVKTLVPKDGETNAVKATDLTLTFDYPLSQGTAYNGAAIRLYKSINDSLVDQINVPSSRFTFSADKTSITLDVQATLVEGTSYYVKFPADVVKETKPDGTPVSFAGYSASTDWNFTVGDYSKPTLAASADFILSPFAPAKPFYPVNGATKVGSVLASGVSTATFYLTFNENVKGVAGKYIKIYNANGDVHELISTAGYTTAASTVSFTTTNLRENTSYYILVDAGAFIDNSGNKNAFDGLADKTKWAFTTRDYSAPVFTSGYAKFGTATSTTIPVVVNLNEKAKVQVVALLKSAVTDADGYTVSWTGTTSATATSASFITAATDATLTLSGPGIQEGLEYVIYYRAWNEAAYFDVATNASVSDNVYTSQFKLGSIKTLDVTSPSSPILFPVTNNTPPVLDGSDDLGHTITMTFTGDIVKAGTGNIIIYNAIDNTVFESIDVTSSKVWFGTASDHPGLVKIMPATKLASSKSYYIKLAKGVIVDASGNKFNGYSLNSDWTFTAADYIAPVPTWSAPAHAGLLQNIGGVNEIVTVSFNENISGVTAADVVIEKNNVVITTFPAPVVNANNITVTGPWEPNSTYVVKVLANKVKDGSNNYITKELHKSYSTDSWDVPFGTFIPASGTITSSKTIKVEFSEAIVLSNGTSITNDNIASLFTVIQNGGSLVDFTATWNTSEAKPYAVITPVTPWVSGKSYTITLSAGYKDLNVYGGAKPASQIVTASYTVVDTTAPTVTFDFTKTNVSVTPSLKIDFSKVLDGATTASLVNNAVTLRVGSATGAIVNTSVSETVTDKTYNVSPSVSLQPGATYYLAVADKAVADPSGNKNVGSSTTFVTASAPELVSVTPAKSATGVEITTNSISLTFAEAVKAGTISPTSTVALNLYIWDTGTSTWTATASSTTVEKITFVGNSATFPLGGNLSPETKYSFSVIAGATQDVDGNDSKAIAVGDYYFTTKDVTAPVVNSIVVPATTIPAADENLSKAIEITYNEPVKRGIGTISIMGTSPSTFSQIIDVNSTLVSFDETNKIVSIAHNKFSPTTGYTLLFNGTGVFEDLAGVDGAVVTATFTTALNAGPNFILSQSFPVDGSDNNAIGSDLILKFDENIAILDGNKRVIVSKETSPGVWSEAQSYRLNETNVTVTGNQINVALVDLLTDSHYKVDLEVGAVKDVIDGTGSNAAVSGLDFFTGDANGPVATFTVAGTLDNGNMVKVDRTANIVITFNEAARHINPAAAAITSLDIVDETSTSTVSTARVVRLALGSPTDANVGIHMEASIDAAKKVITIPASTITGYSSSNNQQYTIFVSNVEDALGHDGLTQSYTFTIDDYTAPATTSIITENKLGTQVVLSLTSNEKAIAYYQLLANNATPPTAAALKANGTVVNINSTTDPTKVTIPTSAGTEYDLYIVAQDIVRNTLQATVTKIDLRTADISAPVVSVYGDNGSTSIDPAVDKTFTVTFGSDIQLKPGKDVYIYNADNNALVAKGSSLTVTTTSGNPRLFKFTVPATTNLPSNGSFYINLDKGIVADLDGTLPVPNTDGTVVNEYAGLYNATTYTFKTKDNQAPYIANALPYGTTESGTIESGIEVKETLPAQNIVITFNEDVTTGSIGAGDIVLKEVDSSVSPTTTSVKEVILLTNSATATLSGKVLTINPVMDLKGSTTYQLDLKVGIVKDASSNSNGFTSFRFTVKDVVAPTASFIASSTNYALTKEPIKLDETLKVKFSENVYLLDKSIIALADVDSLVTLTDAAGKKLAFTTTGLTPTMWTIDPDANFKSNSTYTLSFGEIVSDLAGNHLSTQSVTFTTKTTDSPDIIFAPVNATKDVAQGINITITSSRGLVQEDPTGSVAAGYFSPIENSELKNYVHLGTSATNNDVAFAGTIDADKKVITIDPVVALASGTKYYLTFDPLGFDGVAGTYADLVDNGNIKVVVSSSITNGTANQAEFTVVDYIAPVLATNTDGSVKLTPNDNYLYSDKKLTLEFNEEVIPGTGDVKIYRQDGTLAETIPASALTVNANNKKIIEINPSALSRENNMQYYVIVPEGAIVDKSSLANKFAGLLDNTKWIYSTADTQKPVVVTYLPAKGASNVSIYDNLAVYFDKDIKLGTGNISIYKKGGDAFDVIRVSDAGLRLSVDPVDTKKLIVNFDRNFDANVEYYVTFEEGTVVNAKDGAKFAGFLDSSTWTFSTESTTAPKVVTLAPADDATGIAYSSALTLKMTFDMNVAKGTGTVRVVNTATGALVEAINVTGATVSGTEVTIPMTVKLADNTRYHVFVDAGAFINTLPSKVGFAGIGAYDVWNFTTSHDAVAPTLVSKTPNAETITGNHPTLVMTFDENVVLGAGSVKIVKKSDNTTAVTIPVTASMVSGKTVSVTYTYDATKGGLDKNTDYYVLVDAGAVKDLAANAFAGVTASTTWTFKTGTDYVTPVIPVINDSQFKVYPNPFVDFVTVSNASELSKVVVSNIAGQVVKEVVNPENTIQLNELRSGVYFISLYQDGAVIKTVKIAKR